MSRQLINLSPDLKKLRDNGYSVYVKSGILVIEDVPYVNQRQEVQQGTIVSKLVISGEIVAYSRDNNHVVFFKGEQPCSKDGVPMSNIFHQMQEVNHGSDIITNMSFSSKPQQGYTDYYHKMVTYINMISAPARSLAPEHTAKQHKVFPDVEEDSIFGYVDTNSSRASIISISDKLKAKKVGIIGLGGTGSYILDLVAKTPVQEIHLFDADLFHSHNAFRAPGAPTVEELNAGINKVDYHKSRYSNMHKHIKAHCLFMSPEYFGMLDDISYLFISMDSGKEKEALFDYLFERKIPFVDVGMGVNITDDSLSGIIRTTAFHSPESVSQKKHLSFSDDQDDVYSTNIQIAELNMLNASLAVIKWKQHAGFFGTSTSPDHTLFNIASLKIIGG